MNTLKTPLVIVALTLTSTLANSMPGAADTAAVAEVRYSIATAEWSLQHSSVASHIPTDVMDKSLNLIERAKEELVNGNVKTAREIVQRASLPLARMNDDAMNGRYPDVARFEDDLRQSTETLIAAAEAIATEKQVDKNFIDTSRLALHQAQQDLARGQRAAAQASLQDAYETLSRQLAALRSGDAFYLEVPKDDSAKSWEDGLRRVAERRAITDQLLREAQADGLDPAPLWQGAEAAERSVAQATRHAAERRWPDALKTLELAYVQYEDSWRAMGIDW